MPSKPLPPRDELNTLFRYEPETGKLFWRERPEKMFRSVGNSAAWNAKKWNGRFAGQQITTALPNGHLYTSIWAKKFLVHRIIWKMVHGVDAADIDHINGDASDNRLENLRDVPHQDNGRNLKLTKSNTSGVCGICWHALRGKWHARINVSYRSVHLGLFDSFEDAVAARRAAEKQYGFHANHGRAAS